MILYSHEELADADAWNPDSEKFKATSPKSPPRLPGGFPRWNTFHQNHHHLKPTGGFPR